MRTITKQSCWMGVAALLWTTVALAGSAVTTAKRHQAGDEAGIAQAPTPKVPPVETGLADIHTTSAGVQAAPFTMRRGSLNGGGQIGATSTVYTSGHSVGQSAAGRGSSSTYDLDIGFWFGTVVCPVAKSGDVNVDNNLTSADIIYLVNFVFKGGPLPQPCEAAGDVNCDANVTSADIIYMVNFVFKGGPAPCNICPDILSGIWTC